MGSNSSSEALGSTGNHVKLDVDALYSLYKDVIGLLRAIMAKGQIEMDFQSWDVLLNSLLEIQRRVMNMPEKYAIPIPAHLTDELAAYIIEVHDFSNIPTLLNVSRMCFLTVHISTP